jgi:osmoprotectant transport system permease protein
MSYLIQNPERVWALTVVHMQLVGISLLIAIVIGVPLGILVTRIRWLEAPVINITGVMYTIPSLALFAIMIPFTGIGATTVIIALAAYSLLAIVRNTVAGIDGVLPATLDAARGMGMTGLQRLLLVEIPLALPVILAGVRLAAVAAVGIATIGAVVGAGGLGRLIFDGMRTLNADQIIAGALAASLLAVALDWGISRLGTSLRRDVAPAGQG